MTAQHYVAYKGVKALKASHPEVRRLKREGADTTSHGNKVWRSSFVQIDYLAKQDFPENMRVLEVGCGWGLSGIFMAKQFSAQVTGLDIDKNVKPFFDLQASINQCQLDFKTTSFTKLTSQQLAGYDVLLGADICFWDEMTSMLFNLINRSLKAGVKFICIADPGRAPFWALAERCQQRFQVETIAHSIKKPWQTTKHLLVIKNQG